MNLEERMTAIEKAYGTQSDLMRELRNAVTVTGEWLAQQEAERREHAELMKNLDVRIADLVSGFGALIARYKIV